MGAFYFAERMMKMWPAKEPKTLPLPPKAFRMPERKSFGQFCKEDMEDLMVHGFSREESIQLMCALIQRTRQADFEFNYGLLEGE
ncbi:hypothetical protein B9G55_01375 [Saccharibacillus sp. O16]|nr:hypothetical protein B9G55_01375 [Saccharibacillus sp. O16]